jgi:hypothetical protein
MWTKEAQNEYTLPAEIVTQILESPGQPLEKEFADLFLKDISKKVKDCAKQEMVGINYSKLAENPELMNYVNVRQGGVFGTISDGAKECRMKAAYKMKIMLENKLQKNVFETLDATYVIGV